MSRPWCSVSFVFVAAVAVGVPTGGRGFQAVGLESSGLEVHGTWRQELAEDECPGGATDQGAEDGADGPHPPWPSHAWEGGGAPAEHRDGDAGSKVTRRVDAGHGERGLDHDDEGEQLEVLVPLALHRLAGSGELRLLGSELLVGDPQLLQRGRQLFQGFGQQRRTLDRLQGTRCWNWAPWSRAACRSR